MVDKVFHSYVGNEKRYRAYCSINSCLLEAIRYLENTSEDTFGTSVEMPPMICFSVMALVMLVQQLTAVY